MFIETRENRAAFTLVEIMIVVAIIGMIAVLMIPGFIKNRKQAQGRRTINDARQMDNAISAWSLETGQQNGNPVVTSQAATYLAAGVWYNNDVLNNPYALGTVGSNQMLVSTATKTALDGVGIDWGPY